VESLHIRHYIHCDIKPGNFMIQADNPFTIVFLIDFGLAWLFQNPTTCLHIPYSENHSIVSTLPFISTNGQQGYVQSYHDDLESLAYTIIFLVHSNLPWTSTFTCSDQEAILNMKLSIMIEELCKGLPTPFCNFIDHIHSLGFNEKPGYWHLYLILLQCSEIEAD
jgi:serine/threonine protein kinase